MKYGSIIDYVQTELRSFNEHPLSPVDSLVLSQLAYNEIAPLLKALEPSSPLLLHDTLRAEHFPAMFAGIFEAEKSRALLFALSASPRFRDLELCRYVSEYDSAEGKQFSAMCIRIAPDLCYIAFRGTDDSLVGWKEDFSIAFKAPVPSQRRSAEYFSAVAAHEEGSFILGGHSKGGNLAVYAAMSVPPELQSRIVSVYDHDGPGFKEGVLDNDGYRRIKDRIQKTVPESSLVGMLLDGHDRYSVVGCRRMGGVMQHDPFTWEVSAGRFRPVDDVTGSAKYINAAMRTWIAGLSDYDRERFIEKLFAILDAGKAETFSEITREWRKNSAAIFAAMKDADPEMKGYLRQLIGDFSSILMQSLKSKVLPRRLVGEPLTLDEL